MALSIKEYRVLPKDDTIWVWKGLIPKGGSTLLFGNPKVGKSLLTLPLVEAITDPSIDSYLGLPIMEHGKVLYVQLDTPRGLWLQYLDVVKSETAAEGVYMIDREMPQFPKQFDIRTKVHRDWLRREVEAIEPILVVYDTIRRTHKGDENDPTVMAQLVDALYEISHPAAQLFIHHKKKQQSGEEGDGVARGSSTLMGAVDALINMSKTKLTIEARSDVDEVIPIFQNDDGTWGLNSQQDEIEDFMAHIPPETAKGDITKQIMDHFGVSDRTARRYKRVFGKG